MLCPAKAPAPGKSVKDVKYCTTKGQTRLPPDEEVNTDYDGECLDTGAQDERHSALSSRSEQTLPTGVT